MVAAIMNVGHWVAQSPPFCVLIGFRFLLGFGVGDDYPVSAVLMSEYANPKDRGKLVGMVFGTQALGLIAGPLIALALLGAGSSTDVAWRVIDCRGRPRLPDEPMTNESSAASAGARTFSATQQPQRGQLRIRGHFPQSLVPQRHHHDRVRVRGIGLAALASVKDPGPGRQLGRHIQHSFAAGHQPLHQRTADPVRSLHRPDPVRPLPGICHQQPVALRTGAEPALRPQDLPAIPGLIRDR
jgi:Major Facilitator Superfamily